MGIMQAANPSATFLDMVMLGSPFNCRSGEYTCGLLSLYAINAMRDRRRGHTSGVGRVPSARSIRLRTWLIFCAYTCVYADWAGCARLPDRNG